MGLLSNLLGFRDGPADDHDDAPLEVRVAREADLEGALRLILSPPGGAVVADARAAQEFLSFARERGIEFDALHVAASRNGRLVSAALPVISPGRTMLILCPPGGGPGRATAAEPAMRQLIEPVCRHCAGRGVTLAQVLIDPPDEALERAFTAEGFSRMAELYYLHAAPPAGKDAAAPAEGPEVPPGMNWVTYGEETHGLFGRAILESYQESLDCPALNGRRDVEDVIAGHKATGVFDPSMWFVLREGERSLGVLLLSESLRNDAVELVYLGLAPAARGRRLSEVLMRRALAETARRGQPRLCLAVDSRNTPALKLYYRHGMQRIGSKVALMRDLRAGA